METIELFRAIGKRVSKLPAVQQEEIIETVLNMVEATERMNRSASLRKSSSGFDSVALTKSVSCLPLTTTSAEQTCDLDLTAPLVSSPSDIIWSYFVV